MRAASAALLILSPFTTWMTIVSVVIYQNVIVFGTAAQSNLFQVSANQLGTNISNAATSGATLSIILLILAGFIMFKTAKLGVAIATMGMLAYLLPIYSAFGHNSSGLQQTFVSPGIGLFMVSAGIVSAIASPLTKTNSFEGLLSGIRTRHGLSNLGVFLSTVAFVLDFSNHTVLGQFWDFIGTDVAEQVLHVGLILGIASALLIVGLKTRLPRDAALLWAGLATLTLLVIDAAYNVAGGTLTEFLGHNLTEIVTHVSIYYGVALIVISSFLPRNHSEAE